MTQASDAPVSVPELVGLAAADAHDAALDARLLAVPQNAWHTGAGRSSVTGQRPKAGEELPQGGTILIWVDDPAAGPSADGPGGAEGGGGGGGVTPTSGPKLLPSSGKG